MKTIKMPPPTGFKFGDVEPTGEINLIEVKLDIMERNITFEELCREQNRDPKSYICTSSDPDEIQSNATKIALLIARYFNEGKELDWSDSSQRKYYMRLVYTPSSGWSLYGVVRWLAYTLTNCGARLHFSNPDHVRKAYELFPEVYHNINNLINN